MFKRFSLFSILLSLCTFSCGLFYFLSLYSYNPSDPSFNVASDNFPRNTLLYLGSYISDFTYQMLGVSSFLVPVYLIFWSYVIFRNSFLPFYILRLLVAILCILSLSIAVCRVENDFLPSGCGGVVGLVLSEYSDTLFSNFNIYNISIFGVKYVFFTIFLILFSISFDVNFRLLGNVFIFCGRIVRVVVVSFFNIIRDVFLYKFTKNLSRDDVSNAKKMEPSLDEFNREAIPLSTKKCLDATEPQQSVLPSIDLLSSSLNEKSKLRSQSELDQSAQALLSVLNDFGVGGNIVGILQGPVVTLYEFEPASGTKSSRVIGLADDISRSLSAVSTRISVVPGKNVLAIELPNKHRVFFSLRELLLTSNFRDPGILLPLVLGKDLSGKPFIADLAKMPHVLVAGTTGAGKSVAINAMILSLLYRYTPDECRMIMIDPKMLELSVYEAIPHLLTPVVTDSKKAITALKWAVKEMENRYKMMSNLGVRSIGNYNAKIEEAQKSNQKLTKKMHTGYDQDTGEPTYTVLEIPLTKMPFIVVIVDEMADLMIVAGKDIEASVQRLAQMARAAGIHIIMATQRPSVDVITGVIKANFPSRISFKVTSKIDSRTILGEQGAEQLLGMGDMLFMGNGAKIVRVHGPFVDDREVERVSRFLSQQRKADYIMEVTQQNSDDDDNMYPSDDFCSQSDEEALYKKAIQIVKNERKSSISYIQRSLRIGYNRAANLVDKMEKDGILSAPNHSGKRDILIKNE